MKRIYVVVLLAGFQLLSNVSGQEKFRNLGFEVGVVVPIPDDPLGRVYAETALPYWTCYIGEDPQLAILSNQRSADSSGVDILDHRCGFLGYMAGNFTVLLQAGPSQPGTIPGQSDASLVQTAQVPSDAHWLEFLGQADSDCSFEVSLGGIRLDLAAFPTGSNCLLYAASIPPLAGQVVPLAFRVHAPADPVAQANLAIDSVQFSATPPPNVLWLEISHSGDTNLLTLHGTVPGQRYLIFSQERFAGHWVVEQEIVGASGYYTQTTVTSGSRADLLFTAGSATVDSDGDGLPDAYERYVTGTDPNDPASNDGLKDPDGDGFTNLEEYRMGTDPLKANIGELLGACSRKTGLVISEIMYHPAGSGQKFIELFNSEPTAQDISGYKLDSDLVTYTAFAANTILEPGAFLTVTTPGLPASGGKVRLRNQLGAVLLEVNYTNSPPWPVQADGTGHSLVLIRPSYGEGNPFAWGPSDHVGGSPGAPENFEADPLRLVMINEFLLQPSGTASNAAFIELYNHGNEALDLGGCSLSDQSGDLAKFTIPAGTIIPARGFVSFPGSPTNQDGHFTFDVGASGGQLFLTGPNQRRVLDAVGFGAQREDVSTGRYPDGTAAFHELATQTPGSPNAPLKIEDIVINEIMYHPISDDSDDEYIELYNQGTNTISLNNWHLRGSASYDFPASPSIALGPDAYLLIARKPSHLITKYASPDVTAANTFGPYAGKLPNSGGRIALLNERSQLVDDVTYHDGGRWGQWSDAGGSSLELIDPRSDHQLAANWADSDETQKSIWTLVQASDYLTNSLLPTQLHPHYLEIVALDAGECLVDNVEVIQGSNLVANADFEGGIDGWEMLGTHSLSSLEEGAGYASSRSLHLRASERGDTGPNKIRTVLTRDLDLTNSPIATIRAQARWLRGSPLVLFRLRGNPMEAVGRMAIPPNLGTPGRANSRRASNAGPAIFDVRHSPVLPQAGKPVVVTARAHDPDGIASFKLRYRDSSTDPPGAFLEVAMLDDGSGGDSVAQDGVYSATIPSQPDGTLISFYLEASDGFSPPATNWFPADGPARECLVRFGESDPGGDFPTYRIWAAQSTVNIWTNRHAADNSFLDVTFVYNGSRIIYNAGASYGGSSFKRQLNYYNGPMGKPCNYDLTFPKDDTLLGSKDMTLDAQDVDQAFYREQVSYWMADRLGLFSNHRRFIHLHFNGVTQLSRSLNGFGAIYEDAQRPNSDGIEEWFPDDSNGNLYKTDWLYEWDTSFSTLYEFQSSTLENFTTADVATGRIEKKQADYRWTWQKRGKSPGDDDYSDVYALVDAMNASPLNSPPVLDAIVDVEEWTRVFAFEDAIGNWDSLGNDTAKNMYAYRPASGKWQLLLGDLDISLLNDINDLTVKEVFTCFDPALSRMAGASGAPPWAVFQRAYWRGIEAALNGPMLNSSIDPIIDAKSAALVKNGIPMTVPPSVTKNWVTARRNFLLSQVPAEIGFAITSNGGADFSTPDNPVNLGGTAPFAVRSIRISSPSQPAGAIYQVTWNWTNMFAWQTSLLLDPGVNAVTVQGLDGNGNLVPGASASINIDYTVGTNSFKPDIGEPLGACSRKTGLVVSEIMYHPAGSGQKFIELFNSEPTAQDISGYKLDSDLVTYTAFAANTILEPGAFLTVTTPGLPASGGKVRLRNQLGAVLLEVNYTNSPPWPVQADGTGHSLVLIRPSYGEGNPFAWGPSDHVGGSPGAPENFEADPLRLVMINEFLLQPSGTASNAAFIELYNHGNEALDLGGCSLSDQSGDLAKFTIPAGTIIPARGFVSFPGSPTNQDGHFTFDVGASGGQLFLTGPNQRRVLDAVGFGAQREDVSTGRYPDGTAAFHELATQTPGSPNAPLKIEDIVINEIMYHPISDDSDDEYIELYNQGTNTISLNNWHLRGSASYDFPASPSIALGPDAYLLIARKPSHLITKYASPDVTAANTFGPYAGKLPNSGGRIALLNERSQLVDDVTYHDGGRWGQWSDAGGSSLELIDPRSDHQLAANWADSDETQKSIWTLVQASDYLTNSLLPTQLHPHYLEIVALDAGECLVDNVEVIQGSNLVANADFEGGIDGWEMLGTHSLSSLEEGAGYASSRSLHLRASERGDTGPNKIRTVLTRDLDLTNSPIATIRAQARWLRGSPLVLFRLRGNPMEAVGRMAIPPNLGTPGRANSRRASNAGPAIFDVRHSPVLPQAGKPVVVTARAHDPDGIASFKLRYRDSSTDPPGAFLEVAMLDDGSGGDSVAQDGVYSATIPSQPDGTLISFYLEASDGFSPPATNWFPADGPARECLVRFGESDPGGDFPTYRIWAAQSTVNIWTNRHAADNSFLDVTFVYNGSRIIYNAGASYGGSSFKRQLNYYNGPMGKPCNYDLTFPKDDTLLGSKDMTLDAQDVDQAFYREQVSYWMADRLGLFSNHRRFIHLHFNGVTQLSRSLNGFGAIYEDAQRPNSDGIEEWFPDDSNGNLYKTDWLYEWDTSFSTLYEFQSSTLENFTTADVATGRIEKKQADYRWTWQKRGKSPGDDDYSDVYALVDAMNASPLNSPPVLDAIVDVEEWTRVFAFEDAIGNWDSLGNDTAKNMYAYRPASGKWQLLLWDLDISLLNDIDDLTVKEIFTCFDPAMSRMAGASGAPPWPVFQRAYWRGIEAALNGPMLNSSIDPIIDAKSAALVKNGIPMTVPPSVTKNWVTARRDFLLSQVPAEIGFAITSNGGADFSTPDNPVNLGGTAPFAVRSIRISSPSQPAGAIYPVTWSWTNMFAWQTSIRLDPGMNAITVQGLDGNGSPVPGASASINIDYTGSTRWPTGPVWINEWMASNKNTIDDPADGNADDWFELYNAGDNTFDLSGYHLTDDLNKPGKWTIPAGTLIAPGGFLLVWADNELNQNQPGGDLHANFSLSAGGESIGLYTPNLIELDHVIFGPQTTDKSEGRYPDGQAIAPGILLTPTPRSMNVAP